MLQTSQLYRQLGIREEVLAFADDTEKQLKDRFAAIDEMAEYNQLKVIHAMQENRSARPALTMPAATDTAIREEIPWKEYMPLFSTQRALWYALRSPAAPTPFPLPWQPTCGRETSCIPRQGNLTTPWRK